MSSNAALSAARRRRSNPVASGPGTNMQSHAPPANRILQRTGVPPPLQQPPFNPRMMPPQQQQQQQQQQQAQMRGPLPSSRPQGQGPPHQFRQPSQPSQQHMARPQMPPLPPPVKTAGPLYGIPIHPLVMFKTHDNKLSEHELSIGDCLEQLKEIDERLVAVESSNGVVRETDAAGAGTLAAGDLNDLMNDDVFINGVVDNIMNTTNFASIVDNIIPLKEENEVLKRQVEALNGQVEGLNGQVEGLNGQVEALNGKLEEWKERMQQLEDRICSIGSSENVTQEKNTTELEKGSNAEETCADDNHEDKCEEETEEEES